jgi:AmpD protein
MRHWQAGGWLAGIRRVFSPNQEARPAAASVSLIVIHNISLPPDDFTGDWVEQFFVNRLDPTAHPYFATIADLKVSAHFFIRRSGRVVQFVGCDRRAWHAGKSVWQAQENCNDYSVGIELQGSDEAPYTEAQYESLWTLIDALRTRYPIAALAGHCHIAPGRKSDPGPAFDWPAAHRRYPMLDLPPEIAG